MVIKIFSKEGCHKCEAAKEKMDKLGLVYEEHDLEYHTTATNGWRNRGDRELMEALADTGKDPHHCLPTIEIDGEFFDYSAAMKRLRNGKGKKHG